MFVHVPYLHGVGSLRINIMKPDYNDQVFHHIDSDGVRRHFHVNRMYQIARSDPENFPLSTFTINHDIAQMIRESNGIEDSSLDRITGDRLEEPGIVFVHWDRKTTIIDGNHRLVKRIMTGHRTMSAYAFNEEEARPALLAIPEDVAFSLLGIASFKRRA